MVFNHHQQQDGRAYMTTSSLYIWQPYKRVKG
jgi:hypothetical protein